jgi:hypothetical protein
LESRVIQNASVGETSPRSVKTTWTLPVGPPAIVVEGIIAASNMPMSMATTIM